MESAGKPWYNEASERTSYNECDRETAYDIECQQKDRCSGFLWRMVYQPASGGLCAREESGESKTSQQNSAFQRKH